MQRLTLIICLTVLIIGGESRPSPTSQIEEIKKEITNNRQNLDRIKIKLITHEKSLMQLGEKKKTIKEELNLAEKDLELTRQYIERLKHAQNNIESSIDKITSRLDFIENQLEEKKEHLSFLIRASYKRIRYTEMDALLEATSPQVFLQKIKWMHNIAEYMSTLIESIKDNKRIVAVGKKMLEESRSEIIGFKTEKQAMEKGFKNKLNKQNALLKNLSNKEEHTRLILQQLKARESFIKDFIITLEKKRRDAEHRASEWNKRRKLIFRKGDLLWPVRGVIHKKFGNLYDKNYNTTLFNPGIDIQIPEGTPIIASAKGYVAAIEWKTGYGNLIVLDHENGYYTIYAHLQKFLVNLDQYVNCGQEIGITGETGSHEGPKLHFEIRKGSKALNPVLWLSK
ncbi:MAG: peptidoglycan DD-metalloendopeptidase family protein [bacterium]